MPLSDYSSELGLLSVTKNSSRLSSTWNVKLVAWLFFSFVHLKCPLFPHSMHRLNWSCLFLCAYRPLELSSWTLPHTLRHRCYEWPIWLQREHLVMFFSSQSLAMWPALLHLKQSFSWQSNESWVSLPHSIQFSLLRSLGHSLAMWPNSLQLRHFIVGLDSM